MSQFILILRSDITKDYSKITPEEFGGIIAAYQAWGQSLAEAGHMQEGFKLTDDGGCVLTPDSNGENVARKDGPYVETKEVIGGVYIIEADSYEHAAKLCEGHPNYKFGSIEIREVDMLGQKKS